MGIKNFGLVPSDIYIYKIFSSMFLHGTWMHLIGNMAYLWIFGNNIEDYLGHIKFLIFYLFCGICATLIHVFSDVNSTIPVVGASGAISGILGAYLILYPRAKVKLLVWFGIVTILRVRASIVLIFWFVYQFLSVLKSTGEGGGVAWWAHIGGFIAGLCSGHFLAYPPRTTQPSHRLKILNIGQKARLPLLILFAVSIIISMLAIANSMYEPAKIFPVF